MYLIISRFSKRILIYPADFYTPAALGFLSPFRIVVSASLQLRLRKSKRHAAGSNKNLATGISRFSKSSAARSVSPRRYRSARSSDPTSTLCLHHSFIARARLKSMDGSNLSFFALPRCRPGLQYLKFLKIRHHLGTIQGFLRTSEISFHSPDVPCLSDFSFQTSGTQRPLP